MKQIYFCRFRIVSVFLTLILVQMAFGLTVTNADGVENSYHAEMGRGTGQGMLEKWCALPNYSFDEQGGIPGWAFQGCKECHIGASWNPENSSVDCDVCHMSANPTRADVPTVEKCMGCHSKDTAKRGDVFSAEEDVHIAAGMLCQSCHEAARPYTGHQFKKGSAIDTTEPTMKHTLSCTTTCHDPQPHRGKGKRGETLNLHTTKVACETCHTGLRPAPALASRQWNVFTDKGVFTQKRAAGWLPEHKWYDNEGPGATGDYHLPILTYTERREAEGAKIYPFNAVTVDWFVKYETSDFDDIIIVPEVKKADLDGDLTTTVDEMREFYAGATLRTADMNFSISHSVVPKRLAFDCKDCHGRNGWVLNWQELGYDADPGTKPRGKDKDKVN